MNQEQKKKKLREITDRIQIAMQNNVMTVSDDLDEREVAEAAAKRHVGGYTTDLKNPTHRAAYTVLQKLSVPRRHQIADMGDYTLAKTLSDQDRGIWNTGGAGLMHTPDGQVMGFLKGSTIPNDIMWVDSEYIDPNNTQGHYQEWMNAWNFMNQMQESGPEGQAKYDSMMHNPKREYVSNIDNYMHPTEQLDTAKHELTHKAIGMDPYMKGVIRASSVSEEDLVRMYDYHAGQHPLTKKEAEGFISDSAIGHADEFNTGYIDDLKTTYGNLNANIIMRIMRDKRNKSK